MTARARRNSVFAGFRDNGTQTSAINPSEVVMLDPSSIELFKDSQGREQPDALIPDKVKAIVASAKEIGIQQPAVVRLMDDGTYQMLTGRHRRFAAMELGIELPCQVLSNIDDELAYKIMAETNIPTEEKLPSEQGRIYKAYFDMRHDREDKAIVATLSVIFRVSDKTIYRYINVLRLPKALQDAVDAKIIAIKDFESLLNLTEQHLEAVDRKCESAIGIGYVFLLYFIRLGQPGIIIGSIGNALIVRSECHAVEQLRNVIIPENEAGHGGQ